MALAVWLCWAFVVKVLKLVTIDIKLLKVTETKGIYLQSENPIYLELDCIILLNINITVNIFCIY